MTDNPTPILFLLREIRCNPDAFNRSAILGACSRALDTIEQLTTLPTERIPDPLVGQTWVSPKARIEARTIIGIKPAVGYPAHNCIYFTTLASSTVRYLPPWSWRKWAKTSGARPANV